MLPTLSISSLPLLLTTLLLLIEFTSAWRLLVNYSDGVQVKRHGHHNSHCRRFQKTDAPITSAYFEKSLSADTFVLYHDAKCKEEGYKGHKGNNPVPVTKYLSY
ncbi:hypothetical protein BGX38DRAFT_1207139, partial [Terfezia claveryi]